MCRREQAIALGQGRVWGLGRLSALCVLCGYKKVYENFFKRTRWNRPAEIAGY